MAKIYELKEQRCVAGNISEIIGVDLINHPEWADFQNYWFDLEQDHYMNDGGTYRQRRFGRFRWHSGEDQVTLQQHGPYRQPLYFNPLNGGIDRHFAPVTPEMANNSILQSLLVKLGNAFGDMEDIKTWKINTYFNRIIAREDQNGLPVPEGRHRDGVKFSCLFMSNRYGIHGGSTTLFDLMTQEPIFNDTLSRPGEAFIFRDDTVFHDTTAITLKPEHKTGYRDLLVIEFY